MKEVKNCRKCNMIFSAEEGTVLCKKCEVEEEETFKIIRDYLYDNPGTRIQDLSAELNISVKRIEQYVRNGRLNAL